MTAKTVALAMIGLVLGWTSADAQVVGTFTWQTQPYCNTVSVTIVQQGGVYQLVGTDDLCGAGPAPVTGTAIPSATGVAMGLTIAYPGGQAAQLSTSVSLPSASGTWTDADGHTGPFAFAQSTGGNPRPTPASASAIGVGQLSPSVYGGTGAAGTIARSDHTHDARYYTKGEVDTSLAAKANRPTGSGQVLLGPGSFIFDGLGTAALHSFYGGFLSALASTTPCYAARADLPNGATITSLEFRALDNDTSNMSASLIRDAFGAQPGTSLAMVSTAGASASEQIVSTTAIASPVVDSSFLYSVAVCLPQGQNLYGARVTFTYP